MDIGILLIIFGIIMIGFKKTQSGWLFLVTGIVIIFVSRFISHFKNKSATSQLYENSIDKSENIIDKSKNIIDKIGGINNIDINLSTYGCESQLIVLKNRTIHIGHNNYETEKIIEFDSIIKLEIRVNNAKVGTAHQYSENTVTEIIESIFVYIHTNEYTEELIFRYFEFNDDEIQIKYNDILKCLKRLKVILEDTCGTNDFNKRDSINVIEKSIPEQIREYKELLDIDAITKEEFEMKKKELLNK